MDDDGRSALFWVVLVSVIAVAAALVIGLVANFMEDDDDVSGPEFGTTVSDILGDPESFEGEQVEVSGAINSFIGDRIFVISEDGGDLLVFSRQPPDLSSSSLRGEVDEEDVVTATGEVHVISAETAANLGIPEAVADEFDGAPVVVTERAQIFPEPGPGEEDE